MQLQNAVVAMEIIGWQGKKKGITKFIFFSTVQMHCYFGGVASFTFLQDKWCKITFCLVGWVLWWVGYSLPYLLQRFYLRGNDIGRIALNLSNQSSMG